MKRDPGSFKKFVEQWQRNELTEPPCEGCGAKCCRFRVRLHPEVDAVDTFEHYVEDDIPYLKREGGFCVYTEHGRCSIYDRRPYRCRVYDCRIGIFTGGERFVDPKATDAVAAAMYQFAPPTLEDAEDERIYNRLTRVTLMVFASTAGKVPSDEAGEIALNTVLHEA